VASLLPGIHHTGVGILEMEGSSFANRETKHNIDRKPGMTIS
jgi:hypothetical protein